MKYTKETIHNYEGWLGIWLEKPCYNNEGKQMFLVCSEFNFYDYDDVVKVAEILNGLLTKPEKIKLIVEAEKP